MKIVYFLILLLFSIGLKAQNISEINSGLKLPDSLSYDTEIRIYQGGGITNYSSMLRMFQDNSKKWNSEFFEHFNAVEPQIIKKEIKPKSDSDFVFQNFLRSYALDLPTMSKIGWKLEKRNDIEIDEGIDKRGKSYKEYYTSSSHFYAVDGESFYIEIRAYNKTNSFSYANPDYYLEKYPEVDKLQFMCEILDIVRSEFNIWKKE
jgi:hypothetical protein|tara:strand:+ start:162 stop:776 length:615 start_codon:yes stop_codon:yes gene_type:complete